MPLGDGELAGQGGGAGAMPVVEQFEEIPALLRGEGIEAPVVDEQHVDPIPSRGGEPKTVLQEVSPPSKKGGNSTSH